MGFLLLALLVFSSALPVQQNTPPSAKELRKLLQDAKTREEFKVLSLYYHVQGASFEALAKERKKEWASGLAHPTGGSKYPTGADRARQLYEYYASRADQSFKTEKAYEERAKAAEPHAKPSQP